MGEPYTLDPSEIRGSSGSYLFTNVYRGLFRYHREKGLIPEGAKRCNWKSDRELHCLLAKRKWSNGEPVTADQYIQAFRRLVSPSTRTVQSELLLNLKNAEKILAGKKKESTLGIRKEVDKKSSSETLIFEFANEDPEFLYRLISPALTPIYSETIPPREKAQDMVVNGPYKFKSWQKGRKIELEPNPEYYGSKPLPPPVEILFIDDDDTALRLYETGNLSFLRRLPNDKITSYKNRDDFQFVSMARFDYVGFGPSLKNKPDLRKQLALALNYKELAQLLHAKGRPGCPSLPPSYMTKVPCYDFSSSQTKLKGIQALRMEFSKMGGEDIQRQVEWMQNQWMKHLNVEVQLQSIEQGMYIKRIKTDPPDLFRKGISIDRPTCLAAVEIFTTHHRENYLQLRDKRYDSLVSKLIKAQTSKEKKKLCTQVVRHLLDNFLLIPMGEIHFSILAQPHWKDWHLNEMNYLDLTDLRWTPPPVSK